MPMVVKGDRNREAFDEAKLRSGMEKALEKRPVPRDQFVKLLSADLEYLRGKMREAAYAA